MIADERDFEPDDEPAPVDPFSVPCPFCHAVAGQQCQNTVTKKPLHRFDAHPIRWNRARND